LEIWESLFPKLFNESLFSCKIFPHYIQMGCCERENREISPAIKWILFTFNIVFWVSKFSRLCFDWFSFSFHCVYSTGSIGVYYINAF